MDGAHPEMSDRAGGRKYHHARKIRLTDEVIGAEEVQTESESSKTFPSAAYERIDGNQFWKTLFEKQAPKHL